MTHRHGLRLVELFLLILLFSLHARADVYSVHMIPGIGDRNYIVNADDFGDYTLDAIFTVGQGPFNPCGDLSNTCYETIYADGQTRFTTTIPTLLTDPAPRPGSGCNFTFPYGQKFCNNGHEIAVGEGPDLNQIPQFGIWDGPDEIADKVFGGYDGNIWLMPNGNIFFDEERDDHFFEAVDLGPSPVPEPSTLALFATGMFGLTGIARRRTSRRPRLA